jgi:hypothetical protein
MRLSQRSVKHIYDIQALLTVATSREVAGSTPDVATGIFHWLNPFGRTMALESTQPLTEMRMRDISWGVKEAGVYGWRYHLHMPIL